MTAPHPLPNLILAFLFGLAACDARSPAPPETAPNAPIALWVAQGPAAWADHLAPDPTIDEDGFPALVRLAAWSAEHAGAEDEVTLTAAEAAEYADLANRVAERRDWSASEYLDPTLAQLDRDAAGAGIRSGSDALDHSALIQVARAAKAAMTTLHDEGQPDRAAAVARDTIALAERIGRKVDERNAIMHTLQLALTAEATRRLRALAAEAGNETEVARLEEILTELDRYGRTLRERHRGP